MGLKYCPSASYTEGVEILSKGKIALYNMLHLTSLRSHQVSLIVSYVVDAVDKLRSGKPIKVIGQMLCWEEL